jgi:hypothetical protein
MSANALQQESPRLTKHARERMNARRVALSEIDAALDFGRLVYTRSAMIYAIGRKEVEQCRRQGIELSRFEGLQVVCSLDGVVITVYRNRNLRGLRRF